MKVPRPNSKQEVGNEAQHSSLLTYVLLSSTTTRPYFDGMCPQWSRKRRSRPQRNRLHILLPVNEDMKDMISTHLST